MFVRKVNHKNGKSYIQVVDKSGGHYRVVKSFVGSQDPQVIDQLYRKAREWNRRKQGTLVLDFTSESDLVQGYLDGVEQLRLVGLNCLLGVLSMRLGSIKSTTLYLNIWCSIELPSPEANLRPPNICIAIKASAGVRLSCIAIWTNSTIIINRESSASALSIAVAFWVVKLRWFSMM